MQKTAKHPNKPVRMIVTDLEGTFLNAQNQPHPVNIRAVREAREAGILVIPCTGRNWARSRQVMSLCGFDPFLITGNGSAIIDARTGRALEQTLIAPTALLPVLFLQWRDQRATTELWARETCGCIGPEAEDRLLRTHVRNSVLPEEEQLVFEIFTEYLDLFDAYEEQTESIQLTLGNEIGLMSAQMEELLQALQAFTAVQRPDGRWDLTNARANKAQAAQKIAQMHGIDPSEVLAIGDGEEDIELLRWAGTGVALADSCQQARDAADVVTVEQWDAGVAKAIFELALGYDFTDPQPLETIVEQE